MVQFDFVPRVCYIYTKVKKVELQPLQRAFIVKMNGQEQTTVNELNKKLSKHIEISERQAKEVARFMKDVKPILKSYHDKIIVNEFLRNGWKVFVGVLTVLAIIGSIVSVGWLVLKGK